MDERPVRQLTIYFVAWKVLLFLVIFFSPGYGYDTSTTLFGTEGSQVKGLRGETIASTVLPLFLQNFVRWDSIYYLKTAERGYLFEQEWAFGYGYTRLLSMLSPGETPGIAEISWVGVALSHLCHYLSVLILYATGKSVFSPGSGGHRSIAFLSAVLHIVCPGGAFLSAPYGEAVFSFLNFAGFYMYTSALSDDHRQILFRRDLSFLAAGALFAIATTIRSNGVLSGILFAYDALVGCVDMARNGISFAPLRRLCFVVLGGSVVAVGIIGPQYIAYTDYCHSTDVPRSWCNNHIPSIYAWVQNHYWDVGFLKYWTISNIPLFLLASPMLLILTRSSLWALSSAAPTLREPNSARKGHIQACLSRLAMPQAVLTVMALAGYHVQIITRLSSGYPLWYWYLSFYILYESNEPKGLAALFGRGTFVRGMVLYAVIQGVLFGSFLPPA